MASFRKPIVLYLLVCLFQAAFPQQNISKTYSLSIKRKNLEEVIPLVEKITGLSIAYSPSITSPTLKISTRITTQSLTQFLNAVFKHNGISWTIIDNQIVLRYQPENYIKPSVKIIYGTVRDAKSGELLSGARIAVPGFPAAVTNPYGYFSLQISTAIHTLEIFHPGYKSATLYLNEFSAFPLSIHLEPIMVEMQPVEIRDNKSRGEYWETGQGALLMSQLNAGTGGNDIITAIGTLPGFSLFGDGSTRFFVRGGESSQNLILIDESPVFNPSHLLGFVSSLDASVIREVKAWKGDAPVEYGNRLSGVIDIHTREGNLKDLTGSLFLNPFYSSAIIEAPLNKEKFGFMLSARRSNMEWLTLSHYTPYNFDFSFYDVHFKLHGWVNSKNRVSATLYSSSDRYSTVSESVFKNYGLAWGNFISSLRWSWMAGPRLFFNSLFNSSLYSYKLFLNSRHTDYWNSAVHWYALQSHGSWYIAHNQILRFGAGCENYISEAGNVIMEAGMPTAFGNQRNNFRSLLGFVYTGFENNQLGGLLQWYAGLRLNLWANYGPQVLPYFTSDYRVFATDTISPGKFYYTHTSFEPRLRMVYKASDRISWMASAAATRQYFQPLSNTVSPFTTLETWLPAGPNLKPQSSFLLSAGLNYSTLDGMFESGLEIYYRNLYGQIDYSDHANLLSAPFPEGQLRQGSARAAGIEFRVAKQKGQWNSWLTYTFSRVKKTTPGINDGHTFYPFFDRPHQAMILLKYNIPSHFNTGAAWYFSSGGMTTLPSGFYLENGITVPVYEARYNARLPVYHRLDLFANYRWKSLRFPLSYELSLHLRNVYGRHNPFIYGFNKILDDEGNFRVPADLRTAPNIVPTRLSVNGVIPSISFKVSLQ